MDSILCLMMFKTSKNACVEQLIALKTKNFIKNWEKTLSKVLLKSLMLPEAGTVNFIDSKTKFTSIGKKLIDKLNHSSKQKKIKIHRKRRLKRLNSRKESIGRGYGKLRKVSSRFWKEPQGFLWSPKCFVLNRTRFRDQNKWWYLVHGTTGSSQQSWTSKRSTRTGRFHWN